MARGESIARANWGSQIEFILTLIGFAVGLGNVWRFPYLCFRNGGGAFLVPYFISLFVMGIPLFYMELSFGQFASLGPIKIWIINPAFKGLGIAMVIVSCFIAFYYNVIIAVCIHYFFASMASEVPWSKCNQEWVSCNCRDSTMNASDPDPWNKTWDKCERDKDAEHELFSKIGLSIAIKSTLKWSFERYYELLHEGIVTRLKLLPRNCRMNRVLRQSQRLSEHGDINWELALCLLLTWLVVFLVLTKGIESLGKIVYVTSIFPYVLLTALLIRGCTLDGYYDGIEFYLQANMSKLAEADVWSDAAVQIFYSLSVCSGGLIAMASYNNFRNNCLRDAFLVPIINCATSFYAGFVIFSSLGYMAHQKGVGVADVAAGGPGLAFIAYPEALRQMPVAPLWSVLFFLMMLMLGFSSSFSIVETVLTGIIDEIKFLSTSKWGCVAFRAAACAFGFLMGLPMTLQAVIVFKILQYQPYYVTNGAVFDKWADAIGWLVVAAALLPIPVWFLGYYFVMGGYRRSRGVSFKLWRIPKILIFILSKQPIRRNFLTMGGILSKKLLHTMGEILSKKLLLAIDVILFPTQLCVDVNSAQSKWGPSLEENRDGYRYTKHDHQMPNGYMNFPETSGSGHSNVAYIPSGDEKYAPINGTSTATDNNIPMEEK
ncbi:hypothetical protein CHS0354_040666 [Potamilus streckersoni]|uniref:Transporter n=1 Tax=Potamilus streckersoni TaxID=2493646 RepID=A0AAE0TCE0_9BIVA|nr:hypothetical protein CHS0354_040666 [Potamilus streckersoni]